jgi:hypothetical protein
MMRRCQASDAAEIGLVADLEINVVVTLEVADELAGEGDLDVGQGLFFESENLVAGDLADAVDVVGGIEGTDLAEGVVIERTEEDELDHHAALAGLRDEVGQPFEIVLVPSLQVELVAAAGRPRRIAAHPRSEGAAGCGRQGVVFDAERGRHLEVGTAEGACEVEPTGLEFVEVGEVVEIGIEDGPVVLAGGDEKGRLAAKEEVMGVVGMEGERFLPDGVRG